MKEEAQAWYSTISDMPHLWVWSFTVKLSISVNTSSSNILALKKSGEWCFPRNIWGEGEHLYNYSGGESLTKHCCRTSDSDQQSTSLFPCTEKCSVWGWNVLLYILVLLNFCLFVCTIAFKKKKKSCIQVLDPSLTGCDNAMANKMTWGWSCGTARHHPCFTVNRYKYKRFICTRIRTLADIPCKVKQLQESFWENTPGWFPSVGKIRVCPTRGFEMLEEEDRLKPKSPVPWQISQ